VAGLDYADAAIEISRETLADVPGVDLRQGDVTKLPWPDASFDRILFGDVIEHLSPADADAALREFQRVLRPGGFVLVHTAPNKLFVEVTWRVARLVLRAVGHGDDARTTDEWIVESGRYHPNIHTLHSLRRTIRGAGFSEVHAWLDPEVLRGGEHRLTSTVSGGTLGSVVDRVAAWRPIRLFLGNDLYAVGRP
jgi:ubiquinone/menaquinone biosynthesis C-methylase UbiE